MSGKSEEDCRLLGAKAIKKQLNSALYRQTLGLFTRVYFIRHAARRHTERAREVSKIPFLLNPPFRSLSPFGKGCHRVSLHDECDWGIGGWLPKKPDPSRWNTIAEAAQIVVNPIIREVPEDGSILYVFGWIDEQIERDEVAFKILLRDLKKIKERSGKRVVVLIPPQRLPLPNERDAFIAFGQMSEHVRVSGDELLIYDGDLSELILSSGVVVTGSSEVTFNSLVNGTPVVSRNSDNFFSRVCPSNIDTLAYPSAQIDVNVRDTLFHQLAYTHWTEEEIDDGSVLNYYLPELKRQIAKIGNKNNEYEIKGYSRHLSEFADVSSVDICGRVLNLDPTWPFERSVLEWAENRGNDSPLATKVWGISHGVGENDCVLIAGAGIGFSSLLAIGAGAAEVIAFEPNPALNKRLDRLSEFAIQAIPVALGSNSVDVWLRGSAEDNHKSSLDITQTSTPNVCVQVAMKKVDEICKDIDFDFVLIDSTGSSMDILQGASLLLGRRRIKIILAVLRDDEVGPVSQFLSSYFQSWARIEAGSEGWCRLLPEEIMNCGNSHPPTYVFFNINPFPCDGWWSAPGKPKSIAGEPLEWVDTRVIEKTVPVGRSGLLSRFTGPFGVSKAISGSLHS